MKRFPYLLAGLVLTAAPAFAQNLTLPAGTAPFEAFGAATAPAAQPYVLEQGRSAYERHDLLRHRRQHR